MEDSSDFQILQNLSSPAVDLNCLYEVWDSNSSALHLNPDFVLKSSIPNSENYSHINNILHSDNKALKTGKYDSPTPIPYTQIEITRDEYVVELENLLLQKQEHVDTLEKELEIMKQFYEDKYQRFILENENSKSGKTQKSIEEDFMMRNEGNRLMEVNEKLAKQLRETKIDLHYLENSIEIQKEEKEKEFKQVLEENYRLRQELNELKSSNLMIDLQNQVDHLSLSKAQTEKDYLEYKESSVSLETISSLIAEHEDLTARYEELQTQCAGVITEAEKLNDTNKGLTLLNKAYQTEIQEIEKQKEEILKLYYLDNLKYESFASLQAEVSTLRQLETDLLSNIKSKDSKIHVLEECIFQLETQKQTLEEKCINHEESTKLDQGVLLELLKLRNLSSDQDTEITSLNKQLNKLEDEKLIKNNEIADMRSMIDKHSQLKQELYQLYNDYETLRTDYSKLNDVNSTLTASIKALERENYLLAFRSEKLEKDHVLFENQQKLQNVVYKYLTQSSQSDTSNYNMKSSMIEELQITHTKIKELTLEIIDLKSRLRDYEKTNPKLLVDTDFIVYKDRSDDEMQLESIKENISTGISHKAACSSQSVSKPVSLDSISNSLQVRVRQLIAGKDRKECVSDSLECH